MSAHKAPPGRDFAYPAVGAYDRRAAAPASGPAAMYPRVAHPVASASPLPGAGGTSLHMPHMSAVGAGAPGGGMGGMGGHGAGGGASELAAGPAPIAMAIKTQLRVAQVIGDFHRSAASCTGQLRVAQVSFESRR
ncbi:hypothetical protein CLOP_g2940 [Closterium sp. NIES-67]|nr:hypothetical protein CLOP_g2940 [Closterium sp. NIES-67]